MGTSPVTGPVRLGLPWERPPLSLNDRMSREQRDREIARVRRDAGWVAKAARLGHHDHATVVLHYQPARRGRRDADNLVATLKPVCDGLVDAGLVDDDDPAHMTKLMPVIDTPTPGQRRGRLWLDITTQERP
jgi:crossover junction endodeoxyribonuclease RusA